MSKDNPAMCRRDAIEIADRINAVLLAAEHFRTPRDATAALAIAIAPILARDGRIEAPRFLELCGISLGKGSVAKIDPLGGLGKLIEEEQPKS